MKHFLDVFSKPNTSRVLRHLEPNYSGIDSRGRGGKQGEDRQFLKWQNQAILNDNGNNLLTL